MRTKAEVDVNGGFRVTGSGKMGRPSWTESSSVKKADDARAELKQNLAASAQGTSEASGAPNRVNYRVAWGDGCKVAQENANVRCFSLLLALLIYAFFASFRELFCPSFGTSC